MDKIVVVGGGGLAKVVISILKKISYYEIVGYTDKVDHGNILNIKYLGYDEILYNLYNKFKVRKAVIGIGQLQNPTIKKKVVSNLKRIGFELPVIISPTAIVNEGVLIGEGTIVRDGAVISTGTHIGAYSIVGTSVNISYDSKIGNYVNISLGSNLGIELNIGDEVLIGMGTTVTNYKSIVNNCLIGAGSLVIKDCLEAGVYFGRPAKKIKEV